MSSYGGTALLETQAATEMAAATTQTSYPANDASNQAGLYTADTAVLALGLLGAWMLVVGIAMLVRRMRLLKG